MPLIPSFRTLAATALVAAGLAAALSAVGIDGAGASSTLSTFLFINENPSGPNQVASYNIGPSGAVTLIGTYATGHSGSDASFVAAERADLSVDMSRTSGHLYALNLGDSTVSIFSINTFTGALTLQTTTPPLNATAIAVNKAGTVLYAGGAANEGSANQLSAYLIAPDGTIGTTPVSTVSAAVDGLAVSADGTEVAAAYPGTSPSFTPGVQLFATNTSGALTAESQLPETCPTDVRFGTNDTTLYSAGCSSGALTSYSISSNQLTSTGSVPAATSQTLAVDPDGNVYFETASGLEQAQVSGGTFTLGPATSYPSAQTITSMTVSPDGSQLFVGSFMTATVDDYTIGAGGQLTLANQIPTMSGLPTLLAVTDSCPGVGSTCTDTQNFQVTIDPGTLTISTPYTAANPFTLPALALSPDGTYLGTSAAFPSAGNPSSQQIVVSSTLAGDPGWTLSVSATNLSDGAAGTIASSGFGLTNGSLIDTGTFPGSVTFTNLPAHNPSPTDTDSNVGLTPTPQTWATTPAGDGTAVMAGTLTLLAPTTTPPGTYSGTITFSVS